MKPRILLTRSNPIAPDPRVEKIARTLVKDGYPLVAVGWDRTGSLAEEDESQGFRVHRLPVRAEYGKGLGNLPQLLQWQLGLTAWMIRHHREFDIIHACDFDTILPALLCKRLWHKKVVYDIFDFYADHLRNTPGVIKKGIRWVDLKAIHSANAVILVDDARLAQIFGSNPRICEILYNSPEDIPDKNSLIPSLVEKGSLQLAYIGLLQVERGLCEILHILRRNPQWHLDLAGFGGDEVQIVNLAKQLPNVTWYGRIPYNQAIYLSASADVLFATYDPSIPNHRYSSPNKVFEAMMLGKPLIVARQTNMDLIIEKEDCGIVVKYGDENSLEQALHKMADNPALRMRLGHNARLAYEKGYSWKMMQSRLLRLYQQVEESQ